MTVQQRLKKIGQILSSSPPGSAAYKKAQKELDEILDDEGVPPLTDTEFEDGDTDEESEPE